MPVSKKISALSSHTTIADGDYIPSVDVSEADAAKNKRTLFSTLWTWIEAKLIAARVTILRLAFSANTELTIASGSITVTRSVHSVDTEGDAASDDLANIAGGAEGDFLLLSAANTARTVVVKHNASGTGNLRTPGEADVSLTTDKLTLVLYFDGATWNVTGQVATGMLYADGSVAGTGNQAFAKLTLTESSEVTIAAGAVASPGGAFTIDTESDAGTDDLDTISGIAAGELVVASANNAARSVVIKHGVDNIFTWDGADLTLDETYRRVLLQGDGTNVYVLSVVGTGGAAGLRADGSVVSTARQEFLQPNLTDATELTIAAGVVTKTQGSHTVDTQEDGASDDLDTILGGAEGDLLFIAAANATRTVVVKHGTGNIVTFAGTDISLDELRKEILLRYDGTDWRVISSETDTTATADDLILLQETQTAGTNGGTFTSGAWQARTLAEVVDTGGHCTISSGKPTLAAGTYEIISGGGMAWQVNGHRVRLYNVTDTAVVADLVTPNARADAAEYDGSMAAIAGRFTLGAAKELQLQHRCLTTKATAGMGINISIDSTPECYAWLHLRKIG